MKKLLSVLAVYFVIATALLIMALPQALRGDESWTCCKGTQLTTCTCQSQNPPCTGSRQINACTFDQAVARWYLSTEYPCCDTGCSDFHDPGQLCDLPGAILAATSAKATLDGERVYFQDCEGRYVLVRLPAAA